MTTRWAFEKEVLPLVARMAGGRKKRILTEEQRARLIEAGGQGCPKKNGEIKGHKPGFDPK